MGRRTGDWSGSRALCVRRRSESVKKSTTSSSDNPLEASARSLRSRESRSSGPSFYSRRFSSVITYLRLLPPVSCLLSLILNGHLREVGGVVSDAKAGRRWRSR